jgi:hypothetical protein
MSAYIASNIFLLSPSIDGIELSSLVDFANREIE